MTVTAAEQLLTPDKLTLEPHGTAPFHWSVAGAEQLMVLSTEGYLWSSPFRVDTLGCFCVKLREKPSPSSTGQLLLLRVEVKNHGRSAAVLVTEESHEVGLGLGGEARLGGEWWRGIQRGTELYTWNVAFLYIDLYASS